jgi:hypothetical protein
MTDQQMRADARRAAWVRAVAEAALVVALLCLAVANIHQRSTWTELGDGVLWTAQDEGVTAQVVLPHSPAARAGVQEGDILSALDRRPVHTLGDVVETFHAARSGEAVSYTIVRLRSQQAFEVALEPLPVGSLAHYYSLAAVGIFSLLVGAAVRLRRPDHQATLHFFWLSVAFFGMLALSFSGRLDMLDLVFYWGDVVAMLLLPPLFVHFALMFPERPDAWARSDRGRTLVPLLYVPALLLGGARVAVMMQAGGYGDVLTGVLELVDRLELLYFVAGSLPGSGS